MAITKDFNRQFEQVATVTFKFSALTTGVDAEAIDLPVGAVITAGTLYTTEAWNSTTSDVLDVGDAVSQNRYLNDGNIRAAGALVALVPTGYVHAGGPLTVRWVSGGGTPTTGEVRLMVKYVIQGASHGTFG